MPDTRNFGVTKFAAAVHQIVGGYKISLPLDQQFLAVVTIGVVAFMAGHVADIGIMNSLAHGQIAVAGQRGHRGGGQAVQLVLREKP